MGRTLPTPALYSAPPLIVLQVKSNDNCDYYDDVNALHFQS